MKILVLAVLLAASPIAIAVAQTEQTPPATTAPPATGGAQPSRDGRMSCTYDRVRHAQMCTNAAGETLRCRYERVLGSRLPIRLCTTQAEDDAMERESRDAIDRQQHVTTPPQG